jgi:hypothetical protein
MRRLLMRVFFVELWSSVYPWAKARPLKGPRSRWTGIPRYPEHLQNSHDCHMMMTQILPVAIQGIMDKHVQDTLTGLCNIFDTISLVGPPRSKLYRDVMCISHASNE